LNGAHFVVLHAQSIRSGTNHAGILLVEHNPSPAVKASPLRQFPSVVGPVACQRRVPRLSVVPSQEGGRQASLGDRIPTTVRCTEERAGSKNGLASG